MDSQEDTQLIRQLAHQWVRAELPTTHLSYADYVRAIAGLQQTIGNVQRTTALFTVVINQARTLGKSSEWIQRELHFEALAEFVESRADLLLLDLEHGGPVDDNALDLYNERLNRFTANG
jgi:hypothetical protein